MNMPRRFLMPMWEGGGTIPPELGVARRLVARGHSVHVLGDPTIREQAVAAGCSFSPWQRAPHRTALDPAQDLMKDWETNNPLVMLARLRDRFVAGPAAAYAADTVEAITATQPDAVVPDYLLFGAIMAAQAARLPVVPIVPNIWALPTSGAPAIGPGFPLAKGAPGRSEGCRVAGRRQQAPRPRPADVERRSQRSRTPAAPVVLRPGPRHRPDRGALQPDVRLRFPVRAQQRDLHRADPRRAELGGGLAGALARDEP